MSDSMNIVVEIDDAGAPAHNASLFSHRPRRTVRIEVTLPTGEGSEGPNLEGAGWADEVATLVQRLGGAAYACLESDVTTDEALRELDQRLDAAHQRLDAIRAPDMVTIEARRRQDEELLRREEELSVEERVASERERQRAQASIVRDRPDA